MRRVAHRLLNLPIRVRLTLAFAVATAVLLGTAGITIYLDVKSGLDSSLDASLRGRAADYARLADRPRPGPLRRALAVDAEPAQLVDAQGRVVAASRAGAGPALVAGDRLRRGLRGEVAFESDERARLLVRPAGSGEAIVVSTSMRQRERALEKLGSVLLIGGPLILLIACTAGYLVAAGALRPVDRMRRRAAAISEATPEARLPLPRARDELHRLGETLNAMLGRLAHSAEHERAFLADASHELRTPLAILRTEVDLALHEDAEPGDLRAALISIGEEVDRLARLSEDLLVLARGRTGELPLSPDTVDVGEVAGAVVRRFAVVGGDDVRSDVGTGLEIRADRMRLEQALGNLIDNALRHGRPPVVITAREDAGQTELHVVDGGSGFSADQLREGFDRVRTTRAGGFGLGLAIVASIARSHGGSIGAANTAHGTDVWISLPREAVPRPRAAAGALSRR